MLFVASSQNRVRVRRLLIFLFVSCLVSIAAIEQTTLRFRLLHGYSLRDSTSANKGRTTLLLCEQADTFGQLFAPTATGQRLDSPNFSEEMVAGIALPATRTPPKLSVSRVLVQDSTLTIRYIRQADSTLQKHPLTVATQPLLLVAFPKQTVLRTRLIENGRVVQTIRKPAE